MKNANSVLTVKIRQRSRFLYVRRKAMKSFTLCVDMVYWRHTMYTVKRGSYGYLYLVMSLFSCY